MTTTKTNTPGTPFTDKWMLASQRAQRSATWAKTMTKVLISQSSGSQPAWHIINFLGPKKSEARGIVDLVAIRRNQQLTKAPLKRGDLFEIVLLQVKGGSAKWPSPEDRERLRAVRDTYEAKDILLSEWKRGAKAKLFRLSGDDWVELCDPAVVFCPTAKSDVRRIAKQQLSPNANDAEQSIDSPSKPDLDQKSEISRAAKKAWASRRALARERQTR
jgi:hypothetical protein